MTDTEISAHPADIFPNLHRLAAQNHSVSTVHILLHDHGISTSRHRSASEDANGVTGLTVQPKIHAGRLLRTHDQLPRAHAVGSVQGVTIHHGIVESWNRHTCDDFTRCKASECGEQAQFLHGSRRDGREDALTGFGFSEHDGFWDVGFLPQFSAGLNPSRARPGRFTSPAAPDLRELERSRHQVGQVVLGWWKGAADSLG